MPDTESRDLSRGIKEYQFESFGHWRFDGNIFQIDYASTKPKGKEIPHSFVYVWVALNPNVNCHRALYVGETAVIYYRQNAHVVHLAKPKGLTRASEMKRIFEIGCSVEILVRSPGNMEICGETISGRHAEEAAFIKKFKPYLNGEYLRPVTWPHVADTPVRDQAAP